MLLHILSLKVNKKLQQHWYLSDSMPRLGEQIQSALGTPTIPIIVRLGLAPSSCTEWAENRLHDSHVAVGWYGGPEAEATVGGNFLSLSEWAPGHPIPAALLLRHT